MAKSKKMDEFTKLKLKYYVRGDSARWRKCAEVNDRKDQFDKEVGPCFHCEKDSRGCLSCDKA